MENTVSQTAKVTIDMSKRINRELKANTRIGKNIAKLLGNRSYISADGTLAIIVPIYGLKGAEEEPLDAVELNYHLVSTLISQSGDFKEYISQRKRNNPLVQKVGEYVDGILVIPDIKTALLTHLMPAYTNKEHMIHVELFPDDNGNNETDWDEMSFGRSLNLSSSVLDQKLLMPLIGKFNLFGGDSPLPTNHLQL